MFEPLITMVDGRRVVQMQMRLDCQVRSVSAATPVANRGPTGEPPPPQGDGEDAVASLDDHPIVERFWWRLISAVQAWPCTPFGPQLVDYTHNNAAAIRGCVALINQMHPPVMLNHTEDMRDQAGAVSGATWEDSTDIPPGVSAWVEVSEEFDRKTVVGLRARFITAGSISVTMQFEMSHPEMDWDQFISMQGRNVDGAVVRWLPTQATHVGHFALVPAGADPNARPRNQTTSNQRADNSAGSSRLQEDRMDVVALLAAVCAGLGIEVCLTAGQAIPPTLEARITEQIGKLSTGARQFNELAADLQALIPLVQSGGETSLSTAEIVQRLPGRLGLAAHGEAYLHALRTDACRWYGLAKFEAAKREATDLEKRQMERIRQSCSVQELQDWISEYRPAGEPRLGAQHRTSQGGDLPPSGADNAAHEQGKIRDQVKALYEGKGGAL